MSSTTSAVTRGQFKRMHEELEMETAKKMRLEKEEVEEEENPTEKKVRLDPKELKRGEVAKTNAEKKTRSKKVTRPNVAKVLQLGKETKEKREKVMGGKKKKQLQKKAMPIVAEKESKAVAAKEEKAKPNMDTCAIKSPAASCLSETPSSPFFSPSTSTEASSPTIFSTHSPSSSIFSSPAAKVVEASNIFSSRPTDSSGSPAAAPVELFGKPAVEEEDWPTLVQRVRWSKRSGRRNSTSEQ